MSEETGVPVFVYGTLRKGDCRSGLPELIEVLHEEAYLNDFKLLDLGSFPGIVPEEGKQVRGEVHLFQHVGRLDRIEGYNESRPETSLYIRQEVIVELPNGKTLTALVYVLNARMRGNEIASGDWFQHLEERSARNRKIS